MSIRAIVLVLSVVVLMLGGLWLVQGLGLVTVPPVLCVADCEPLLGPSPGWALAGLAAILLGMGGLRFARRRRS